MENIVVSYNKVESEAYQTFTQLKQREGVIGSTTISNAILIKRNGAQLQTLDEYMTSNENALKGSLIGALIGVLGGPIGMLLGLGVGAIVGSISEMDEMETDSSLIGAMTSRLEDGDVAIIALVQETDEKFLDELLNEHETRIVRYDAALVTEEVEHAQQLQKEMEKQTRQKLSAERSEERKAKVAAYKEKIKSQFEHLKKNKKHKDDSQSEA